MPAGGKVLSQPRVNLFGKKFGRWTVEHSERHHKGKGFLWNVVCECGKRSKIEAAKLTSGQSQSCGCAVAEALGKRSTRHGLYGTPIYETWRRIIDRCHNPNSTDYEWYGLRGIKVCDEWRASAVAFASALPPHPGRGFSIDRIDTNGNYEPGNVRWATIFEQNNNKRNTKFITFRGETLGLGAMARKYGLPTNDVYARISAGWSIERALTEPLYSKYHNNNKKHST